MLIGHPPFSGNSEEEIMENIVDSKNSKFNNDEWLKVSELSKDLILKMIMYNYKERISAKEALGHPWIINFMKDYRTINNCKSLSKNALKNLKNFKVFLIFFIKIIINFN